MTTTEITCVYTSYLSLREVLCCFGRISKIKSFFKHEAAKEYQKVF